MKQFILTLCALLAVQTLSAQKCDKSQSCCCRATIAQQLEQRLAHIQQQGYMMGHQDDPFYGLGWAYEEGRSDVKDVCGDYPGVMGFDLGGIEMGDEKNLDSVPFSLIRKELVDHHLRGGIVTLSWHPRNPLTGGNAWDVSNDQTVRSVLYGGPMYMKFQQWLCRVADFIATLKTPEGEPVPVIFRPWHENNGSWFWWGEKICSASEYHALWNMTQDYMAHRGLTNLLWSYSPNLGDITEESFEVRYPGDDRVTLIGLDAYQWGTEQEFIDGVNANLATLSQIAAKKGKLFALTECGLKNMTDPTWFSRVLKPQMDKYPIAYFLLWRNAETEFFGPSPKHACADDFKKLYKAKNTLFLKETSEIK